MQQVLVCRRVRIIPGQPERFLSSLPLPASREAVQLGLCGRPWQFRRAAVGGAGTRAVSRGRRARPGLRVDARPPPCRFGSNWAPLRLRLLLTVSLASGGGDRHTGDPRGEIANNGLANRRR